MSYDETILLLCGNFNPIGNMHLRMFEIARDHLIDLGYSIYKGVVVPFDEDIDGQNLVSMDHRLAMIKYALNSSDWIQLSTKQCRKLNTSFLIDILQHHQTSFDFIYKNSSLDSDECKTIEDFTSKKCRIMVKLLCGADFMMFLRDSEEKEEVQKILINYGVVVISREGYDIDSIVYENDLFWTHRKNIMIIKDQIENQITCSKIRKAISRGRSIKYLVNDAVERYICLHNLYIIPDCEYKNINTIKTVDSSSYEVLDSFQEFTWHSQSKCSSADTLTNTTAKKSKLSLKSKTNRCKKEPHFKNVDKSKLIEIPLTEDGVIQIIADRETNL
ncbi:nicotinamide/nicotinic acid mononucleotide adenylyltransferase 1-like [Planococcus citri]|uniref:nicotinamide/nicotinic acid mononucleotide adenylyltransferase 1-like n=1 Tax=Planococcus citri TaxID=170843 RepID=UPI0031F84ABE